MNGLAKLLKALFPQFDWSSPDALVRNLLPGIDAAALAGDLQSLAANVKRGADELDAMRSAILELAARQVILQNMLAENTNNATRRDSRITGHTGNCHYDGNNNGDGTAAGRTAAGRCTADY